MKTHLALFAAPLALLAACASGPGGLYEKPYALFQLDPAHPQPLVRPAWIAKIDGQDISFGRNDPVQPGLRKVELSLSGPPGSAEQSLSRDTIEVDAKPCTRYYFSSKRSSLQANDWKAFVSGTEPIGDCASRFGLK